ncbi:DUF5348 domain-containing protein (plasmid) [Bacillus salacetis]|uniref:DUF5348 domain-containing protein n=1 Tax=Bacillus salacetis TaxID=2315464 RepID=UPI003BA2A1B0
MKNSKEITERLLNLRSGIDSVLKSVDYESQNVVLENRQDPDEYFTRNQAQSLLNRLKDINDDMQYLAKPIIEEGVLSKQSNGRYAISGGSELTSGSLVEVFVYDRWDDSHIWAKTRIEHTNGDYYFYDFEEVTLAGARVRRR